MTRDKQSSNSRFIAKARICPGSKSAWICLDKVSWSEEAIVSPLCYFNPDSIEEMKMNDSVLSRDTRMTKQEIMVGLPHSGKDNNNPCSRFLF